MKLKTDFIREQFPAFKEAGLKRWAHFENAGGSYMAGQVADKLAHYFAETRVQPYHPFPVSKAAGKAMDDACEVMAQILNVPQSWMNIGPSTSANTYTLSHAFGDVLKEGQNIIVTNQDHEANSGFWRRLERKGAELREWSVGKDGCLNPDDLWPLIDKKTLFVAFPHVSNIVGMINPVAEICAKLRDLGVISIVDEVSYVPHAWPDIAALGADIYLFSAYKTYGPHQGVMVVRDEVMERLPNQGHYFNDDEQKKRLNPAGPDHAQVAALGGVGDYIETIYKHHFKEKAALGQMARALSELQRAHESKHLGALLDALKEMKTFRLIGSWEVEKRVPTVSLYHKEMSGEKLAKMLSKHGIMAAGGHFYAPRVFKAMGLDAEHGALRLSFVHYVKGKEIELLIKALKKLDG